MKRIKLLPSILMLVLCVGILAIGVYAASPITGTINGTINITAAQGVKIAVYRGTNATAENLIDSAFGSSQVELAAGGATLDASAVIKPEDVTAQIYTVVLSTNQSINYIVDTETIEVFDGVTAGGEKVEGAVVITKQHKPTADSLDYKGRPCLAMDKPYTIQIAVQCGKISTEAISVNYDINIALYRDDDFAAEEINGIDYLYFGEYPQDEVDVSDITLTEDGVFYGYDDNLESETAGGKVARPAYTDGTNRYVLFESKYYQIQPLKWRILNQEADGTTMLMCDTIVEQVCFQQFYDDSNYATDKDGNILKEDGKDTNAYANNYNVSTLRNYLIDTFYNGAFSTSEQVIIKSEDGQVDNSATSHGSSSNADYACANTNDPVFAPSVADVTKTAYGFVESAGSSDTRKITASAYATATGVYSSQGLSAWWLRSPYSSSSLAFNVRMMTVLGSVNYVNTNSPYNGCVPAMVIGL